MANKMKLSLVNVVLMLIITCYKGMADPDLRRFYCSRTFNEHYTRMFMHGHSKHQIPPLIRTVGITEEECMDHCNNNVRCRGVGHIVADWNEDGKLQYKCELHDITVQELRDAGEMREHIVDPGGNYAHQIFDKTCTWIPFMSHFYKSFDEAKSWFNAKKECEVHGGYLLEITSRREQDFIKDHMSRKPYWIGLKVNPERVGDPHKDKDKFWWLAKRELPVFTHWNTNQPDNDHEKCVEMLSNGYWNDNSCSKQIGFWCEKDRAESWIQNNGHLYKSFSEAKSWFNAKKECEINGGYLLEITSSQEHNFIKKFMSSGEKYWIGLRVNPGSLEDDHKYRFWWVKAKARPDFTAWASGHPHNWDMKCGQMTSNGYWNDNSCSTKFHFWCEKERAESWILYNGHLYKSFYKAKTWYNAKKECEAHNGYLVEITSSQENNFIKNYMSWEPHWIGLKRGNDKFWWVNKNAQPEFTAWRINEPGLTEDCVEMQSTGWNDNSCSKKFRFWCEKDRAELKCTYPLSHEDEVPEWPFRISYMNDDTALDETCQNYCSKDENCWSVKYFVGFYHTVRSCTTFNITVQDLKDSDRWSDIEPGKQITYDKQCECTNEYPVSHNRTYPTRDFYLMGYMRDDSANPETCWNYCNVDVNCRSVLHETQFSGASYCHKFSISVQDLKNMGRDDEIHKKQCTDMYTNYITYDRHCAELSSAKCTYPVSLNYHPNWKYYKIDTLDDETATAEAKTCQDWCNEDVRCKSVQLLVTLSKHYCMKFDVSIQELKDKGRDDRIYFVNDTASTAYDKYCECPPGLEPSSYLFGFCKPCSPGFFKASEGNAKCTQCQTGWTWKKVSEDKTSCVRG